MATFTAPGGGAAEYTELYSPCQRVGGEGMVVMRQFRFEMGIAGPVVINPFLMNIKADRFGSSLLRQHVMERNRPRDKYRHVGRTVKCSTLDMSSPRGGEQRTFQYM